MISIDAELSEGATAVLSEMGKLYDTEDLLDEAEAMLLNRIRTRFLDNVDSRGVPWKPSQAALNEGRKTLLKTWTLFHSIQAHSNGPGSRGISTDVPYGIYHNEGTAKLPKREFLAFGDEDLFLVEQLIIRRFQELGS